MAACVPILREEILLVKAAGADIRSAAMAEASYGARGRPQTAQTSRTLYAHTQIW